jgi:hypothetical protein
MSHGPENGKACKETGTEHVDSEDSTAVIDDLESKISGATEYTGETSETGTTGTSGTTGKTEEEGFKGTTEHQRN